MSNLDWKAIAVLLIFMGVIATEPRSYYWWLFVVCGIAWLLRIFYDIYQPSKRRRQRLESLPLIGNEAAREKMGRLLLTAWQCDNTISRGMTIHGDAKEDEDVLRKRLALIIVLAAELRQQPDDFRKQLEVQDDSLP